MRTDTGKNTARFILDQVLAPVPHHHYVLAIPRMLRPYFQRHRPLLKRLYALAHESLVEYLRTVLDCPEGVPGIILALHTFGEYSGFSSPYSRAGSRWSVRSRAAAAPICRNHNPGDADPSRPGLPPVAGDASQTSGRTLPCQGDPTCWSKKNCFLLNAYRCSIPGSTAASTRLSQLDPKTGYFRPPF